MSTPDTPTPRTDAQAPGSACLKCGETTRVIRDNGLCVLCDYNRATGGGPLNLDQSNPHYYVRSIMLHLVHSRRRLAHWPEPRSMSAVKRLSAAELSALVDTPHKLPLEFDATLANQTAATLLAEHLAAGECEYICTVDINELHAKGRQRSGAVDCFAEP